MTTAEAILISALIFMSVSLMGIGYMFHRPAFAVGASGGWMLVGIAAYNLSTATWDLYYGMFWLGIVLVIVSALEAMVVKTGKEEQEVEEEDSYDRLLKRQEKYQARQEKMGRILERDRGRSMRRSRSRRRMDEEDTWGRG